jgi:hypothetical protein
MDGMSTVPPAYRASRDGSSVSPTPIPASRTSTQPGSARLVFPDHIGRGWTILLPADARDRGPATRATRTMRTMRTNVDCRWC